MERKAGLLFPLLFRRTWACWHAAYPAAGSEWEALLDAVEEPVDAISWKFIVLFRLVLSSFVWDASAVLVKGNMNQAGEWLSIFSARGRNVGEVSLKVGRTHALSIHSHSLEISRKKISNELRGVIGFAGYKVRALWPCSEQRRSWCSVRSQGQH